MPNLYDWDALEYVATDGSAMLDGSLDSPNIITSLTVGKFEKSFVVVTNAIQLLWLATNGDPADFQYLRIKSSVGDPVNGFVMLELTTDTAGSVGTPQVYTIPLVAGFPFKLFSSQSYGNYTANFAGGTLKKIDRLRVKNLNVASATVELWMAN